MHKPKLVDSHCHLDFPDFEGKHDEVITRARAAGVTRMVTICTRLRLVPQVQAIAESHDGVFFAAGTHPMSVAQEPMAQLSELCTLAAHPKFVGIGESGLDYHYSQDSSELQKQSLDIHIEAAQETGLPLIIHNRASDEDMIEALSRGMKKKPFSCVMHCFSSGQNLAEAAIEMGFYLSMSGIAAFPKSHDLRAIFAKAPVDRILVETDSPYLAPPPHRGKRNEPAYVAHTAQIGAEVFGLTFEDFAAQTSANFDRLFTKVARGMA